MLSVPYHFVWTGSLSRQEGRAGLVLLGSDYLHPVFYAGFCEEFFSQVNFVPSNLVAQNISPRFNLKLVSTNRADSRTSLSAAAVTSPVVTQSYGYGAGPTPARTSPPGSIVDASHVVPWRIPPGGVLQITPDDSNGFYSAGGILDFAFRILYGPGVT